MTFALKSISLIALAALLSSCSFGGKTRSKLQSDTSGLVLSQEPRKLVATTVPVSVSATELGYAGATIPIETLPVGNGFVPKIALAYSSSQTERGLAGVGWGLRGTSVITRCPLQNTFDGVSKPISWTDSDGFCLDGKKLLLVSGEQGSESSEYTTYLFEGKKIVFTGGHFEVFSKGGEHQFLGSTAESREDGLNDKPYSYYLDKVLDRAGNTINFSYEKDGGRLYLKEIAYGGNDVFSKLPYRSLVLNYDKISPLVRHFVSGQVFTGERLLKSIEAKSSGETRWTYRLHQAERGPAKMPVLQAVDRCWKDLVCTPKTTLDYDMSDEITLKESPDFGLPKYALSEVGIWSWKESIHTYVDLNGDGFVDLLAQQKDGLSYVLSGPDGKLSEPVVIKRNPPHIWHPQVSLSAIADMNKDGHSDIVHFVESGDTGVFVSYWTDKGFSDFVKVSDKFGTNWSIRSQIRAVIDVNNDGWPDVIGSRSEGIFVALNDGHGNLVGGDEPVAKYFLGSQGWMNKDFPRYFLDVNSDGYPDILGFFDNSVQVFLGTGSGFLEPKVWLNDFGSKQYNPNSMPREIVDMNGDGLPDLLVFGKEGVDVALNTGAGFEAPVRWLNHLGSNEGWAASDAKDRMVFDINKDGYPDLVGFGPSGLEIYLGSGVPTPTLESIKTAPFSDKVSRHDNKSQRLQLDDLDGNGQQEFFLDLYLGLWKAEINAKRVRLTAVKTGLGEETRLSYRPITDGSVYQKNKDSNQSTLPVVGALDVLSEVQKSNGLGGFTNIKYRYENAFYDRDVFGFLGFEKHIATDSLAGTETVDTYSQDTKEMTQGALLRSEVFSIAGERKPINRTISNWTSVKLGSHPLNRALHEDRSESTFFDEQGDFSYSVVMTKRYDEFQNVSVMEVVLKDKTGEHRNLVETSFKNDPSRWILGLPEDVTTTSKSSTSAESVTKHSIFSYDGDGLLVSETSEPQSRMWIKKEYSRTRNSFGLVDTARTSWAPEHGKGLSVTELEERSDFDGQGFLEKSINALGQTALQKISQATGLVESTTDLNGLTTIFSYDESLRLKSSLDPDGRLSIVERSLCDQSCPALAVIKETTSAKGFGQSTVYLDSLGRTLRSVKSLKEGREVAQDFEYNAKGLLSRTSKPYFVDEKPQYWTLVNYDERNRQHEVTLPDLSKITLDYDGLTTVQTNALGQREVRVKDSRGLLLSVENDKREVISYGYDAAGRLIETKDPAGNLTRMQYDVYGRRTMLDDPTTGKNETSYNALGLSYLETRQGVSTELSYDALGRALAKKILGLGQVPIEESYVYDQAAHGLGKIARVSGSSSEMNYAYDELSRPVETRYLLQGKSYVESIQFDELGRVKQKMYPSGLAIGYRYDAVSQTKDILDQKSGKALWSLRDIYPSGEVKEYLLGNGVIGRKNLDEKTDRIKTEAMVAADQSLQTSRSYSYDSLGNLKSRQDDVSGVLESFSYDRLNRLETFTGPAMKTVTMVYDELSRIKSRSDVGEYSYGKSCEGGIDSPFVPKAVGGKSLCSDGRGNIIKSGNRSIRYDLTDLPVEIKEGGKLVRYQYGIAKKILSKEETIDGESTLTRYVGDGFETERGKLSAKERAYVGDFLVIETEGSEYRENYLYKDYLGSTIAAADQSGNVIERMDYDPFGQRRKTEDLSWIDSFKPKTSSRGFTGHDHIDSMSLIHMKGRVYDPTIGLFLTADSLVQDPTLVQNLNRYSYVVNNPLSYNDPSGHSFKSIFKKISHAFDSAGKSISNPGAFISSTFNKINRAATDPRYLRLAASIAISVVATICNPVASSAAWYQSAAYFAAVGYTSSYVASNGDSKAALNGAITGAAFSGVGSAFDSLAKSSGGQLSTSMTVVKVVSHGAVGGLSSQAAGGNFESGFWSAGLSEAAGQYGVYDRLGASDKAQGWGMVYGAGVATVVGGSISEVSGGTFEQGALNASMGRLFNHFAHAEMIGGVSITAVLGEAFSALGGYIAVGAEYLGAALGTATPIGLVGVAVWSSDIGPEAPLDSRAFPVPQIKNFNDPTVAPDEGWEWKGRPGSNPGSKAGNWVNPSTGESLRPDLNHPEPIGPHWDWKDPNEDWHRIDSTGRAVRKK